MRQLGEERTRFETSQDIHPVKRRGKPRGGEGGLDWKTVDKQAKKSATIGSPQGQETLRKLRISLGTEDGSIGSR